MTDTGFYQMKVEIARKRLAVAKARLKFYEDALKIELEINRSSIKFRNQKKRSCSPGRKALKGG